MVSSDGRPSSRTQAAATGRTAQRIGAENFRRESHSERCCCRRRGAKIVLGGLHVMSCPDQAAPYVDALAAAVRLAKATAFGGDVYVLEFTNSLKGCNEGEGWQPRIRKIGRDGNVTTLATVDIR